MENASRQSAKKCREESGLLITQAVCYNLFSYILQPGQLKVLGQIYEAKGEIACLVLCENLIWNHIWLG